VNPTWSDVWIVIRAVRGKREQCCARLLNQIEAFSEGHEISYHGDGRTVPESYADALSVDPHSRKWVLQFEDDAILRRDFAEYAIQLLRDGQDLPLISMYSGRRTTTAPPTIPELERLPGARFLMAQAFFIRSDLVPDHNAFMLDFCRESDRPYATDTATALWLKARKYKYGRAWPSIVQHDDVASLYGHHRNPNRFASSFTDGYQEP
jgi:hypothetical protein